MPKIIAVAVIRTARRRAPAPSRVAAMTSRPSWRARSANVTSRIEFATAMPIAMIAPMKDCTFSVVPVSRSIRSTPHSTAGIVSRMASASRTRLEIRGQQEKIASDGEQQADAQAGERLFERRNLAPHPHRHAARGRAGIGDSPLESRPRTSPSVMPWMLAVRLTTCWPL